MSVRGKLFDIYAGRRDVIAPGLRPSQHFYERRGAD
jgi:hypothetical protein